MEDRRSVRRQPADFFAVELSHGARYLRRVCNVSASGLLMEDRFSFKKLGTVMRLELPRVDQEPVTVNAQVVRITRDGGIALRAIDGAALEGLGGAIVL